MVLAQSEKKKKKKISKPLLTGVADFGSSSSKVVYEVDGGLAKWMIQESEHLVFPNSFISELNKEIVSGEPENNAWVRLSKDGDCHLLGFLASSNRAFTSIKKLKSHSLKYKILGIVGAIAKKENLGNSFDLKLSILLPFDEYVLTDDYIQELRQSLKSFYFQDKLLKIKLKVCHSNFEGSGMVVHKARKDKSFKEKNFIFLMQGYRNTSCITYNRGILNKLDSGTCDLGFNILLKGLLKDNPGLKSKKVYQAIDVNYSTLMERVNSSKDEFDYLETEVKMNFDRITTDEKEKERLMISYENSMNKYCTLMRNWLDETLPDLGDIDEVVLSGGASNLLSDFIKDYLKSTSSSITLSYSQSFKELKRYLLWKEIPGLKDFLKGNYALRFADAWGVFVFFAEYDLNKILDPETGGLKNG